jgi:transcriptional regulator with XRE-family HTH domain
MMGQRPNALNPEKSPLHRWGYELRELRMTRGLSLRQLARKALIDHSHLGRFERAERMADDAQAERLDRVLDAGGMLIRLWERMEGADGHVARPPPDVARARENLASLSSETARSVNDDLDRVIVPCRTRDGRISYMTVPRRALLFSGMAGITATALASPLEAMAMPQRLPTGGPSPVEHYRTARRVLIQADNLMGSRHVMGTTRRTIAALRELRKQTSGKDAFDLLELQVRYGELAGWFAQDIGDTREANTWTDHALRWAHGHGNPHLISYVLGRRSQLAADTGDRTDALDLAEAAQRDTPPRSRLHAISEVRRAHGLALQGMEAASLHAYDRALAMVGDLNDPGIWGSWLDTGYVQVQRMHSLHLLGHHQQAAEGLRTAIDGLPVAFRRDRGVYLAREASVYASINEPEHAASVALEAVAIADETGSARIITELAYLDREFTHRWPHLPEVIQFRSALDRIIHHE